MCSNLGTLDRVIRLVLGLALWLWMVNTRNYIGLLGFVLLLTAGLGWCPLYLPLHLKTCAAPKTGQLAHKH
ncbi:DUF2892 domain-containing protein [bacterium]|nr:DUF2892 domain-containing protein [bacterium]